MSLDNLAHAAANLCAVHIANFRAVETMRSRTNGLPACTTALAPSAPVKRAWSSAVGSTTDAEPSPSVTPPEVRNGRRRTPAPL